MPFFITLFEQTKGQPITWEGKRLFLWDIFPVKDGETLRLIFESVNSDWQQGVELATNVGLRAKGGFIINGEKLGNRVILMQDISPQVVEFTVRTKDGKLYVNNAWQKPPAAWAAGITYVGKRSDGAAMIVEELPNGRRYRCNDGRPDDDFDDIIFRIERVNGNE